MPLGPIMAHSQGSRVYIGLYREKHEQTFSSEAIRPRALIYSMEHGLVDLYQVCPPLWGHMFYIGLYREKHGKIFLSETKNRRAFIFGMYHDLVDIYQSCSNYPLGPKLAPPQVSPGTWPALNIYLYVCFKQNSGERLRATWPSCYCLVGRF